jgi:arylalkylamine N-acetyltransferase
MAKAISIRVAEASDYQAVLELLQKFYYKEEPITISHPEPGHTKDDEEFTMSWIPHKTVLVAVDDETGKIVGALNAGPIEHGDADAMIEDAKTADTKKWRDIMLLLAYLEKKADVLHRFGFERALHIHALGVDSSYRGQKIGEKLFAACFDSGKHLGYPMVSTDCTSVFSINIAERLGMECIETTTYSEYNESIGEDLFKGIEPNTSIKTFVKLLNA